MGRLRQHVLRGPWKQRCHPSTQNGSCANAAMSPSMGPQSCPLSARGFTLPWGQRGDLHLAMWPWGSMPRTPRWPVDPAPGGHWPYPSRREELQVPHPASLPTAPPSQPLPRLPCSQ